MKSFFLHLYMLLFAIVPVWFASCSDDELPMADEPTEEPVVKPELKIEVKTITHSSMSFAYTTSNATACYALVRESVGVQFAEPSVVIEQGEGLLEEEKSEGVYIVESLTPNTRYDIDFVAVNGDEFVHLSLSLNTLLEPNTESVLEM